MGFSGGFMRTVNTDPVRSAKYNWGAGVNPKHSDTSMENDQGYPAPTHPPVPVPPEYIIDSYDAQTEDAVYIAPTEFEPKGHDGSGRPPLSNNRYDQINSDVAKHSEDRGSTQKNTAPMVMRSVTQSFATPRVQSLPTATDDASASSSGEARRVLRGLNSLAMNNPGSPEVNGSGNYIRRGYEIFRITDRSMPLLGLTHTKRPIYTNVAQTAHVTTSPQGKDYTPYTSPYPSVGNFDVGTARPIMRREPRPYGESEISDGSDDNAYSDTSQYISWGLLWGM